ncbi:MAG: SDR family oxidoreductase [Flavobacteriaceae bacterium]|nr:SDR family oxidoreductase [Flavobacteriaceae bacterium]
MPKNVIITGASRGIGYELAQLFAKAGHQVLTLSRNIKPISDLNIENLKAIPFDLGEVPSYDKVTRYINNNWNGRVDILVNNAGNLINKPFERLSFQDFENVYRVNVFGVAELTRVCIPFLKDGSHVVTVSSMGGIQGSMKFPGLAAYSSSKGAVITLNEVLAEEYKESGVAFNVLAIGAVQTEMLEEAFPGYQAPLSAEEMAAYMYDFALTGNQFYNGKTLQVSSSTP